jgi:hypothetical protein
LWRGVGSDAAVANVKCLGRWITDQRMTLTEIFLR